MSRLRRERASRARVVRVLEDRHDGWTVRYSHEEDGYIATGRFASHPVFREVESVWAYSPSELSSMILAAQAQHGGAPLDAKEAGKRASAVTWQEWQRQQALRSGGIPANPRESR